MNDFLGFCALFVGGLLVVFGIFTAVLVLVFNLNRWSCEGYEQATGTETVFVRGVCYANSPDLGWLPLSELEVARVAERGLSK